ncbi:MAG TPA: hypothetical protein VJK06_07445 [Methyloceanibacter sp.]|jgi:uncharacterized membrane protein|nr:hypothetical protein [Methyloceanibacter sp.]
MEFSSKACINFGWETFKKRPWFYVGASLLILLAYLVCGAISGGVDLAVTGDFEQQSLPGGVVNLLLGTLISMGATAFYLNAHDHPETAGVSSLWHPHPFWSYLVANLAVGILVAIGFVLLIVPGVIAMLMFMFSSFIVIDREKGPFESMAVSKLITKGKRWPLLGLVLLLTLINIAGLLALVVGLFVTIPVSMLAFARAYRVLAGPAPATRDASLSV